TVLIDTLPNRTLRVSAKRSKGSAASPGIARIQGPSGPVGPLEIQSSAAALVAHTPVLSDFGSYSIVIRNTSSDAGYVNVGVTRKASGKKGASGKPEPNPIVPTTVTGAINVPGDYGVQPSETSVSGMAGEGSVEADGSFSVQSIEGSSRTMLIFSDQVSKLPIYLISTDETGSSSTPIAVR